MGTLVDIKVLFSTMKKRLMGLALLEILMCFIVGYAIRYGGPIGWAVKELISATFVLMLGMSIYECQEAVSKNFFIPFSVKMKGMALFALILGAYDSVLVVGIRRFFTSQHEWSNAGLVECIQKFVYTESFGESIVIDLIDNIFFMTMLAVAGLMFEKLRQSMGNKKLLNIMMLISGACLIAGTICTSRRITSVGNAFVWLYWIEKYFILKLIFRVVLMALMLLVIGKKGRKAGKNDEEA